MTDFKLAEGALGKPKGPVAVIILDGWGENVNQDGYNACHIAEARVGRESP